MHPLDPLPLGDACFSPGTDPVCSKGDGGPMGWAAGM